MKYKGDKKRRGPSYHMIIHALQTVLHLNKKYLSNVRILLTCTQNRLLYTLNSVQIRLNNANKYFLLGFKDISNTSVFL